MVLLVSRGLMNFAVYGCILYNNKKKKQLRTSGLVMWIKDPISCVDHLIKFLISSISTWLMVQRKRHATNHKLSRAPDKRM